MNNIVTVDTADFEYCKNAAYALAGRYPMLKLISIGKSVLNRDIYALCIGRQEDSVLYVAAFHGQEWLTSAVLLKFTEELCRCYYRGEKMHDIDIRKALFGRSVIIIPQVNPDGVELAIKGVAAAGERTAAIHRISRGVYGEWNANANGVDINHNFNAGWKELRKAEKAAGIFGPSPRRYGGPFPESEPETAALCELCRNNRVRQVMALHSQGEEIYWHYGKDTPPKSRLMAQIMSTASGYRIAEPEGLAVGGGFKDWFISEFHRPGFTVELGRGKNPLPLSDLTDIYHRVSELLLLFAVM